MSDSNLFSIKNPWEKETHKVWLASTLQLRRNFAHFSFPAKLHAKQKEETLSLANNALTTCSELDTYPLFPSSAIGPKEKEYLLEHFLLSEGLHQAHGGEGFVIDKKGDFLGIINVEDHLRLLLLDTSQEIEKSLNRLIKIESAVGSKLPFAYNERFGFLTADPKRCGTAFSVSLFLHIPAIIHSGELTELLEREKEDEVLATGLQGNVQEMIGDILVARNICTLGLTEEYILTTMRMWATRAIIAEISLRKKLIKGDNEQIKNKVTRALGLLTHSYQFETIEALNALSLVKLGVDIGWITHPKESNITKFLFDCRRAHLLQLVGPDTEISELPKKRAEYLHSIAEKLQLTI